MSNEVRLRIGSKIIEGWTSVTVNRSIDTLAGSFSLSMLDVWGDDPISILPWELVSVFIGDDLLITGWLDEFKFSVSSTNNIISLAGRCITADLVDCSAVNEPGTWKNVDLLRIVDDLTSPFDLHVVDETDLGAKFSEFSINQGETVYEAITRACRDRAVVALSEVDGILLLTNIGKIKSHDGLVYGSNVASAEGDYKFSHRFSKYIVKGQQSGKGKAAGKGETQVFGEALDLGIRRYRPKLFSADNQLTNESAAKRAAWEAQVRNGRSLSVSVEMPTWRQSNGDLWRENLTTFVQIPKLRVDNELVIREIEYTLESERRSLRMRLADPDIYAPEPKKVLRPKKKSAGQWDFLSG